MSEQRFSGQALETLGLLDACRGCGHSASVHSEKPRFIDNRSELHVGGCHSRLETFKPDVCGCLLYPNEVRNLNRLRAKRGLT